MKKIPIALRENADDKAHKSGVFLVDRMLSNGEKHTAWDESSAYVITKNEVDTILDKISPIVKMSRDAIDFLLDGEWGTLGIPRPVFEYARNSFDDKEIELFSRFDFAYLGNGQIKLVGIDADAPSLFVETAESQRVWLWDKFSTKIKQHKVTQLNSIPEMTLDALSQLLIRSNTKNLHIVDNSASRGKDWIASSYIKGLAERAGWNTERARLKDLYWNEKNSEWLDPKERINNIYKQFPWDLLLNHGLTRDIIAHSGKIERLFEPSWKMILNNRAILPALFDLYPRSSIISPAFLTRSKTIGENIVSSPFLKTVSQNEVGTLKGRKFTSWGEDIKNYSKQKSMTYRKLEVPKRFKNEKDETRFLYISAFTVAGNIAGIGLQETKLPLLGANSTFKPHVVML